MKKKKGNGMQGTVTLLLCIAILLGAPLFKAWKSHTTNKQIVQHNTQVTATVTGSQTYTSTDSEGNDTEDTVYHLTWEYGGKTYTARRENAFASSFLNMFRGDYSTSLREGRTFAMYIDPSNPARSVMADTYNDNALFLRLLAGITAVSLALVALRTVLRLRRNNRQAAMPAYTPTPTAPVQPNYTGAAQPGNAQPLRPVPPPQAQPQRPVPPANPATTAQTQPWS